MLKYLTIEKLTTHELNELIKKQEFDSENKVKGFYNLFTDTAQVRIDEGKNPNTKKYNSEKKLKKYEQQAIKEEFEENYDINIVAKDKETLVGIIALEWTYDEHPFNEKYNFWNYESRFIEVKEGYKGQKISTKLLKKLEQDKEIQGKVIRFGNFSDYGGKEYIKSKIPKIFSNKNYIILPKLDWEGYQPPEEPGCYITQNTL